MYASAKRQNNYFGFGTDNKIELAPSYLIIKHNTFPKDDPQPGQPGYDPQYRIPCGKVLGGWRARAKAFRPESVVNVSAMSFGSLSAPAVEALNRGCALAGCLHNTGEGGVAPYHQKGGDLIWQIGTGYFGCRGKDGGFDLAAFLETVAASPVKAIEIKLSQGAKPGLGGVLPNAKITQEIAGIRRIEQGRDCISPSHHTAFSDADGLIDFVEELAERTGLPIGIKSAVGELDFWHTLAEHMASTGRGVDYIAIDGGEGGTGAAPLTFSDHVSLPFKLGFTRVYRIFAEAGLHEKIVFVGSGKLGFPETGLLAFGLGADMIAIAREAMLAIGCIQAQRCHTGHCPTGVATQNRWLMHGLDPDVQSGSPGQLRAHPAQGTPAPIPCLRRDAPRPWSPATTSRSSTIASNRCQPGSYSATSQSGDTPQPPTRANSPDSWRPSAPGLSLGPTELAAEAGLIRPSSKHSFEIRHRELDQIPHQEERRRRFADDPFLCPAGGHIFLSEDREMDVAIIGHIWHLDPHTAAVLQDRKPDGRGSALFH